VQKTRKVPLRKCVVTNERHPKQDLIRVVKTKEGDVFVDPSGRLNGRGAYVKRSLSVINKAEKTKRLDKQLGITIPEAIYETLRAHVEPHKG